MKLPRRRPARRGGVSDRVSRGAVVRAASSRAYNRAHADHHRPDDRRRRVPDTRVSPARAGPWPAVLFFMDGPGIRPALFEMAERLVGHGYYVVLPDLFTSI